MSRNKLAVLGGGPAGLQSAITGIENGLEVELFEKSEIGKNFSCAEGFFDSFQILSPPARGVCFKVDSIFIKSENSVHKLDCKELNLWMLDRKKWQQYMGELCEYKGVIIRENIKIRPEDLNELNNDYDWIIDATGVPPVTSRYYDMDFSPVKHCAPAYQVTLQGDFSYLNNSLLAGVEPHYQGYYWIFPKGKNMANVGLGFFSYEEKNRNRNLKTELGRILKLENISDYNIISRGGGLIPVKIMDRLIYDNIILVGDGAGLASPLHGGGIDLALISGDLAVRSIIEERISSYENDLMNIIKGRLELENTIVKIWSQLGHEGLEELLELLLNRKSLLNIPRLFKYSHIISAYKQELQEFYKGFFEGKWPSYKA